MGAVNGIIGGKFCKLHKTQKIRRQLIINSNGSDHSAQRLWIRKYYNFTVMSVAWFGVLSGSTLDSIRPSWQENKMMIDRRFFINIVGNRFTSQRGLHSDDSIKYFIAFNQQNSFSSFCFMQTAGDLVAVEDANIKEASEGNDCWDLGDCFEHNG